MRIETLELKIYKYEELSTQAKEKAFNDFCHEDVFPYIDENSNTIEKFRDIFPISNLEWEYGHNRYVNFRMNCDYEEVESFRGVRLLKYLWNNYKDDLFKGKYFSTNGYYDSEKKYHYKSRYSKTILSNSCPLSGYYMDDVILQPIYEFMNNPSDNVTLEGLMARCLNAWVNSCDSDYEYHYSEDNFKELNSCNDWEYTEDGTMY